MSAPRIVYEMVNRCVVPNNLGVLHSCDNPACVNPDHLRVGTQKDNMRECSQKGRRSPNSRQRPGEDHSLARITWDDAREIRRMAGDGVQIKDIAQQFPIGPTQVRRIVLNLRWREEHAAR
jgi:hypothetical protein